MSSDCVFCKIAAGTIPANKEFEDETYVVFHDLHPKAKTHLLIIPKRHLASVDDMKTVEDVDLIGGMFLLAKEIAAKRGIAGYKLQFNVGPEGGQEIMHVHLHFLAD
jgi:histidine triad (HIT) family protein